MVNAMMNARPVRRQDLFNDGDSSTEDESYAGGDAAAARAALDALMARSLGLDLASITAPAATAPSPPSPPRDEGPCGGNDDVKKEEPSAQAAGAAEFAFRLFSSSGKKAGQTKEGGPAATALSEPEVTTVILYDDIVGADGPLDGPGGLANPPRPLSAYIAAEPSPEELARYVQTAVSGELIVAQAAAERRNAWGLEVSWRARTTVRVSKSELQALLANALPDGAASSLSELVSRAANTLPQWASSASSVSSSSSLPPLSLTAGTSSRKRRPGKKHRIALRQREKARIEKEEAAKAQLKSKEEHLLEKKKRLNRIKKLRRREKKREEKKADGSQGGDGDDSDSSDDSKT